MNGIIDNLKAFWDWFVSTPLPEDSFTDFVNIMEYSCKTLIDLAREYIAVIWG